MNGGPDKRRHERQLCSSLIEVSVLEGRKRGRSFCAVIEDVSSAGVCLLMDGEMEVGTMTSLQAVYRKILAIVRHCTQSEPGEFRIGLEFLDYQWAENDWWPEHRFRIPGDSDPSEDSTPSAA